MKKCGNDWIEIQLKVSKFKIDDNSYKVAIVKILLLS
jgi:hypothetical protein